MKKVLILILAIMLLAPAALAQTMLVHITATCYDTNHVGKNWAGTYYIDDYQTFDGDVIDLPSGKHNIYTAIGEYDSTPDIGEVTTNYNVTYNRLNNGFTVDQYLTVAENSGNYRDYWSEWYVTYEFIPCQPGTSIVIH